MRVQRHYWTNWMRYFLAFLRLAGSLIDRRLWKHGVQHLKNQKFRIGHYKLQKPLNVDIYSVRRDLPLYLAHYPHISDSCAPWSTYVICILVCLYKCVILQLFPLWCYIQSTES